MKYVSFLPQPRLRCPPSLDELERGLVLQLHPNPLREYGARGSDPEGIKKMKNRHYFVCVSVGREDSRWCPMFSKRTRFRQFELPREGRAGLLPFMLGTFYLNVNNVWRLSHEAICAGFKRASDRTGPMARNRIDPDLLKVY